jgi:hypothetical protein
MNYVKLCFFSLLLSITPFALSMQQEEGGITRTLFAKKALVKPVNIVIENKTDTVLHFYMTKFMCNVKPQSSSKLEYPSNYHLTSDIYIGRILTIMGHHKGCLALSTHRFQNTDKYFFELDYMRFADATYQSIEDNKQLLDLKDSCNLYTLKLTVAGDEFKNSKFLITADSIKSLKDIALSKVAKLVQDKELEVIPGNNITHDLYDEIQEYLKNN